MEQQKQKQKSIENWLIGNGEPKAPSQLTVPLNLTSGHQPPKSSTESSEDLLKLSDKDRQMVASNWLLNKELRAKLEIKQLELKKY